MKIQWFIQLGVVVWLLGWCYHTWPKMLGDTRILAPQWACLICGKPKTKGILSAVGVGLQIAGLLMISYEAFVATYIPTSFRFWGYLIILGVISVLANAIIAWLYATRPHPPK
jgi:hypothetical protein